MAAVQPGFALPPGGVPWLYALFAMLFVFFLFVMFAPFLLDMDQPMRNLFFRCRCWLPREVSKERDGVRVDHLGMMDHCLPALRREASRREGPAVWEETPVAVQVKRDSGQAVGPVTSI